MHIPQGTTDSVQLELFQPALEAALQPALDYDIQRWQNETGIQVLYPVVTADSVYASVDAKNRPAWDPFTNSTVWYQLDKGNAPLLDANGNYIPAYTTNSAVAGATNPYNSKRIDGDNGSYIYCEEKSGSVQCRIEYGDLTAHRGDRETGIDPLAFCVRCAVCGVLYFDDVGETRTVQRVCSKGLGVDLQPPLL